MLQHCPSPSRKTAYDLISVEKPGLGWVNIDSQAPNQVVGEWLRAKGFTDIHPEFRFGQSRLDFRMQKDGTEWLL